MVEQIDVVVVGAGQAGLSSSHELSAAGVAHTVLDREGVGSSWASRWDSFCLVTPNHAIRLPGGAYTGPDPHGYLPRDGVVEHLRGYAASFAAPVRPGVEVRAVRPTESGGWVVETPEQSIVARAVVLATGAYQRAHRPAAADGLVGRLPVLDSSQYRNPDQLPDGAVLVVGSGQSGCQIAEELLRAGRRVVLACGRAPWVDRRVNGQDIFDAMAETDFLDDTTADLPGPGALLMANVQASGAGGGHDLHYRTLAAMGVQLTGRLLAAEDGAAHFADDLAASVAFGDARRADLYARIDAFRRSRGLPGWNAPDPTPFTAQSLDHVDLGELAAVIIACGYRPAYGGLVAHPDAFDALGFPLQRDGASTVLPGLFFVGVHFLRRRSSSLLIGVGQDASVVAEKVVQYVN